MHILTFHQRLPEWSLEPIFDDKVPSTEDYRGKPLLVLIFSLGCPGCLGRAIPYANRIIVEHGDKMNVMGIHSGFNGADFSNEQFRAAREKFFIRFPFYKDQDYDTTFHRFKAGGTPHWVLTNDRLEVEYSIFGSDPNNALMRLDFKLDEVFQN